MHDGKIKFTWGGGGTYSVNLCIKPGHYEPIIVDLPSCASAQQISQRGNAALQRNGLLTENLNPGDLPGTGHDYQKGSKNMVSELIEAAEESLKGGEGHDGECTNDVEGGPCLKHVEMSGQRDKRLREAIAMVKRYV